jgi:hypothetical protein
MSKGIAVNNGYGGNFLVLAYPEVQMEMNMKDTLLIDGVADFAGNMAVEGSTVTLTAADSGIGKGTASKGDAGNLLISEADVTLLNVYIYEGVSLYGNGGNSTYCFSPSFFLFCLNLAISLFLSSSQSRSLVYLEDGKLYIDETVLNTAVVEKGFAQEYGGNSKNQIIHCQRIFFCSFLVSSSLFIIHACSFITNAPLTLPFFPSLSLSL